MHTDCAVTGGGDQSPPPVQSSRGYLILEETEPFFHKLHTETEGDRLGLWLHKHH